LLEDGPDLALQVLSRQNPLRRAAAAVVTNKYFELFILALILANCVTLAMWSRQPGFDETELGVALSYTDYVFAAIFSLELLLKVVAMGLVWKPGTYLRNGGYQQPAWSPASAPSSRRMCQCQHTSLTAVQQLHTSAARPGNCPAHAYTC
jgi:hypothetical protein